MIDIAAAAKEIAGGLLPVLSALLSRAETDGVSEFAKKFGDDAWSEAKSVWQALTSYSQTPDKLASVAHDLAANPNDQDTLGAFRVQIRDVLKQDPGLAEALLPRIREASRLVSMKTGHGSQIAVTDSATFTARDIDMSLRVGLTSQEMDERDERNLLKSVLAQFNRRAVHDHMHEETLFFMTKSLHELRVNVQKLGVSTIRDKSIKLLLRQIQDDIREMEAISFLLSREAPDTDWADSILDLRIFGGTWGREDYEMVASQKLTSRLDEVRRFLSGRVDKFRPDGRVDRSAALSYQPGIDDERKPRNIDRLAKDMLCIYIFGAIDQLKARVIATLEILEDRV